MTQPFRATLLKLCPFYKKTIARSWIYLRLAFLSHIKGNVWLGSWDTEPVHSPCHEKSDEILSRPRTIVEYPSGGPSVQAVNRIGFGFRFSPLSHTNVSFSRRAPVRHVFEVLKLDFRYLLRNLFSFALSMWTSLLNVWLQYFSAAAYWSLGFRTNW